MVGKESGITKVNRPDHPDRCQGRVARGKSGQCWNTKVPGSNFCLSCKGVDNGPELRLNNYRLSKAKWQQELIHQANSSGIKSLRDEIAILRVIMQERLNTLENENDLILQSGAISDLVGKIERIVVSCHKLEGSMGQLVDKSALLQFAGEVVGIGLETATTGTQAVLINR